jgi:predicted GIY-YIG superfamily endonuclease
MNTTNYVVYLLVNSLHNKTYVGITNNTQRRIRQHNGELVGGAKYTTTNKPANSIWSYYGWIPDVNKHLALSFEKKIKIRSKKMSGSPIERRLKAINNILTEYNLLTQTNYNFVIKE